jgi:hypothetical protein
MDRRTFIGTVAGGYFAKASIPRAQQQERVRRVGALIYLAADDPVHAQRDDGATRASASTER